MSFPHQKNIIIAIVIALVGILIGGRFLGRFIYPPKNNQGDNIYKITEVIDGDTFKINDDKNNEVRVRLLGIDAPEKGACYYNEAKDALTNLITNRQVRLEKDITNTDVYGRLLRYGTLINETGDNLLLNDYLVRNGFAIYSFTPPDKQYQSLIAKAQEEAKKNKIGLWGVCEMLNENSTNEQDNPPVNPGCIIKGNISEKGFGKTYLIPGCDNYESVKIDFKKGEQYFCSEADALSAGFRKATNCP